MDGANIEIAEEVARLTNKTAPVHHIPLTLLPCSRLQVGTGLFIFGVDADDVPRLREERAEYVTDERWDKVIKAIRSGEFGDAKFFKPLMDNIDDMQVDLALHPLLPSRFLASADWQRLVSPGK